MIQRVINALERRWLDTAAKDTLTLAA
jgi:hypothetical protein